MYPSFEPIPERRIQQQPATRRFPWLAILVTALVAGLLGALIGARVILLSLPPATEPVAVSEPTSMPTVTNVETTEISVDINSAVTDAVAGAAPAVVTVLNNRGSQETFYGGAVDNISSGSGVFISSDGYLITNQHVVEGAQSLEVIFSDGEIRAAELIGEDTYDDLAVLRVEGEIPAYIQWGNSDTIKPGETVIAIGSPLGAFQNTVTVGVVSATDRAINVSETYELEGLIQTDAAINQGNSGGPLINLNGELVGINTLIIRGSAGSAVAEGLGFSIPSNTVRAVSEQLIQQGYIARPYVGIRWGWISPEIAARYNLPVDYGVYVTDVVNGGPAAEAGLKENDIVIAIEDRALDQDNPFTNLLFDYAPGEEIELTIYREGETISLPLILGEISR